MQAAANKCIMQIWWKNATNLNSRFQCCEITFFMVFDRDAHINPMHTAEEKKSLLRKNEHTHTMTLKLTMFY